MGGHPTGFFTCACGFVYARSGPDTTPEDRFRRGKIIQFGLLWEETLRRLWHDPSFSVNAIARRLGVDPLTVKRSAVRLGLSFIRRHEEALIQLKPVEPSHIPTGEITLIDPASQREAWLAAMQAHPEWGTRALRGLLPGLYAWLYRHDRKWLQAHLPVRRQVRCKPRINWARRDKQFAEKVRNAAVVLKNTDLHPIRITVASIGRTIRQLALIQQHLDKLPLTSGAIAEVIETREDFALRRVQWATMTFLKRGYAPERWEFIQLAGLARVATWATVDQAIQSALHTLEQQALSQEGEACQH